MEPFSAYETAILSLAFYALVAGVLSAMVGIRKSAMGVTPGASFESNYDNPSYRLDRAYMNTTEKLPFVATVIIAAILVGVWPIWVNLVAVLALITRLAYTYFYVKKVGAPYDGIRTHLTIASSVPLFLTVVLTAVFVIL